MSFDAPFLRLSLLDAAKDGDIDAMIHSLDEGGDSVPNLIDSVDVATGMTALHYSCRYGFVEIVCLLVRSGASFTMVDHFKKTPLHYACHYGHDEVVYVLLDCPRMNVEKLYYMNEAKLTCLQTAAARGYDTILRLLLLHGDVVNGVNELGETALHLAAQYNHLSSTKILIHCGASTMARTIYAGDTPLHFACRNGSLEVAVFLVTIGQSIHLQNTSVVPQSSIELARSFNHSVLAIEIVHASKAVRTAHIVDTQILDDVSKRELEQAKTIYKEAREALALGREKASRQQKNQEIEAINLYLRAIRNGQPLAKAEAVLASFPRLQKL